MQLLPFQKQVASVPHLVKSVWMEQESVEHDDVLDDHKHVTSELQGVAVACKEQVSCEHLVESFVASQKHLSPAPQSVSLECA